MTTQPNEVLKASELDSNISLISHSDTSNSTVDSLERFDTIEFDDDTSQKQQLLNDILKDSLENLIVTEKTDSTKDSEGSVKSAETNSVKSSERSFQSSEGSCKSSQKSSKSSGNSADSLDKNEDDLIVNSGKEIDLDDLKSLEQNNNIANMIEEKNEPVKEPLMPSPTRSKIPKSKTFDNSIFNQSGGKIKFQQPDEISERQSPSRNHVFMTSQECMVVPGCSKLPRSTIASRLRFEKQHSSDKQSSQGMVSTGEGYHAACVNDGYQTPLQRKDLLMKDLRRQIREMKITCEEKDREIGMYKQHVDEETSKLVQSKDEEIDKLRDELRKVKQSYEDISNFCEESITAASQLERKAEDLKHELTDREKQHQKIYLEMYRKGQDSARFEREEELERIASSGGCRVTISELVKKLAWTELELAKWQTLRRQESYHNAFQPETEADATLRFLKDSFFHYITDTRESEHHLRAIIKIFKFTEPQMAKIKQSKLIESIDKKRKKKSKK